MGRHVAETRDEGIAVTTSPEHYRYEKNSWPIDFVDSRGVGDTNDDSAIKAAIEFIVSEQVDMILFVVPANDRSYVAEDVNFLNALKRQHKDKYNTDVQIILVINKVDCVASINEWKPPYDLDFTNISDKEPQSLRDEKERNIKLCIKAKVESYKTLTSKYIAVCSYKGKFDEKLYNTNALIELIYNSLPKESQPGFAGAVAFMSVKKDVARTLSWSCALIAGSACFVPIPGLGSVTIVSLQACLVSFIARLAHDNEDTNRVATAFIKNMGGYGAGAGLAILIQELTVLLPIISAPINFGAASTVAGITYAMGIAATSHFIDGMSMEESSEVFKKQKEIAADKFLNAFSKREDKDKANAIKELEKEFM